jgi:hypothetical protein
MSRRCLRVLEAQRPWVIAAVTTVVLLAAPAGARAFDTGPHSDITRDALRAEGFGATATDVVVVNEQHAQLHGDRLPDGSWPVLGPPGPVARLG